MQSKCLTTLSRRELLDLAIAKIEKPEKPKTILRKSPYHDAREFMQHESDLQFKMDRDEFEYIKQREALK
jgi:hypothetical protein